MQNHFTVEQSALLISRVQEELWPQGGTQYSRVTGYFSLSSNILALLSLPPVDSQIDNICHSRHPWLCERMTADYSLRRG